ncbi:Asp23/Gls24 family envelope stress response protein [Nocardiopsis sp. RSe5-2]|uniref:Asp23/Gls24 family envelope stress response protein n=1 Tax=Nocardiopsis endophytica TaxID=3018445 RepID=A0ABT4UD76_9ACTN|nr:Asp23/Gls24 family envelope stress response protein [Nocardiopsis endophytica]MDA2814945.1 Asp23/Gls24 family envelope stress response protein [Nocardiopsis endophytica]
MSGRAAEAAMAAETADTEPVGAGAATAPAVPDQRTGGRGRHAAAPPAEERGSTHIPASVVEKIAARVAREVPRTRSARAQARVRGGTAVLKLALGVDYPAPLRRTCAAVRERVATRVAELTGLAVPQVDIEVTELRQGRVRGG